tara:strand:- start:182 stop:1237 length:1056 start_codon:yes stop_codon:yes gene_type:complete
MLIQNIGKPSSKKIILYRVDFTEKIGLGHFKRCLNFANLLGEKKFKNIFIIELNSYKSFLKLSFYKNFKHQIFVLNSRKNSIQEIKNKLTSDILVDLIVVDKYEWNFREEIECRIFSKKVLVFDDLANRKHNCDFLIDLSFNRKKIEYKKLVNKGCELFLGPEYSPFSKSFYKLRKSSIKRNRNPMKKILVSFGGSDQQNITSIVVSALAKINENVSFFIVTNKLSSNYNLVKKVIKNKKNFFLVENCNDLSNYYSRSDLCIGAGGFSSWERCYLGLPTIVIKTAKNQDFICDELNNCGAIKYLGRKRDINANRIFREIEYLRNNKILNKMSKSAKKVIKKSKICHLISLV